MRSPRPGSNCPIQGRSRPLPVKPSRSDLNHKVPSASPLTGSELARTAKIQSRRMLRNCPNTRHRLKSLIKLIPLRTLAVLAACLALSAPAATATEAPVKITTFGQLSQLAQPEAEQNRPAQIRGTVLCCDNDWGQLFIHDGKQARYFSPQTFATNLQSGQTVEIQG